MYRDIPNTIIAIRKALREAKVKYEEVIALSGTPAYSADTYSRLIAFSELVPKVLFGNGKRLVTKEVLTQRVPRNQDQEMSGITRQRLEPQAGSQLML